MRPEVLDAMAPYWCEHFGNPSSAHRIGRAARSALENARERVAGALHARPDQVFFVRGGTEADNLAIQGCAAADPTAPVVISAFEHPAVAAPAQALPNPVRVISVRVDGGLDLAALDDALAHGPPPAVVSIMWVNNETGDVQPLADVAKRTRAAGVPLHTDAVQAAGRIAIDLSTCPVDLLSISAHKVGGPKGSGVLFVRRGTQLQPLLHGGAQEKGMRPGTVDVAGAVGTAEALAVAVSEQTVEADRLGSLRDRLEADILAAVPRAVVHGVGGPRAPHISNIGVPGPDRTVLLAALDARGIAASPGAACSSGSAGPSPVIEALYGKDHPLTAVRFSLGHTTTEADTDAAVRAMSELVGDTGILSAHSAVAS